jgi:hypothetical protein
MKPFLIPNSKITFFKNICNFTEDLLPEIEQLRGQKLYIRYSQALGYKDFNELQYRAKSCTENSLKHGDILYAMITSDYTDTLDRFSIFTLLSKGVSTALESEPDVDGAYLMSQFHKACASKKIYQLGNTLYRNPPKINESQYGNTLNHILARMKALFDSAPYSDARRKEHYATLKMMIFSNYAVVCEHLNSDQVSEYLYIASHVIDDLEYTNFSAAQSLGLGRFHLFAPENGLITIN